MQHFSNTNLNNEIKELLYKSWYRGCKETDILIGNYVRSNAESMEKPEIEDLKKLMEENDYDIYNWITGTQEAPRHLKNLISKMSQFNISNARSKTQ